MNQAYATRRAMNLLSTGTLVVLSPESAVIKLDTVTYNGLGWPVWTFKVLGGVTQLQVLTAPPTKEVEVVLPLIDVLAESVTVFDVYVQATQASNGYELYSFLREALATSVLECAIRFELHSFIVRRFHATI